MATSTLSPVASRSKSRIAINALLMLAGVTVLALAVAGLSFRHAALASLPQLDGEIRIAGLTAPVTVLRDQHGVPHINARSLDDLFFAQGYITAQDRLWQMDINRRYGRGELAEILGDRALALDKRHRLLQTRTAAEQAAAALDPRNLRFLEAYARGVNALIGSQRNNLPIEFRILRYEPRPWTVVDSLIIGVNIAESLSAEYQTEYKREQVQQKLSAELAADLYVNGSWRDHPPGDRPRSNNAALPAASRSSTVASMHPAMDLSALTDACESCSPGSNNWVVSGEKSSTGKPLLSNDMHLAHSIPGVWYEVHLQSDAYNVTGVSFPGLPFVVGGHNQYIAWGYTNLGPDVQDLFVETFNAAGDYQTPNGWEQPVRSHEVIKVKGEDDVVLETLKTRHGPIISALFPGESRKLALQWTLYDPQTVQIPFFDLNSARDWKEFLEALQHFSGATQNVVFADVEGNIGYHAAGWVPVRRSGLGEVPVPGADGSHDWIGYVPFDKLPSAFNPVSGVIGTANARVTPEGYPFHLANQWSSPYRTERIYRVLTAPKRFSPEDMTALQMDTYSEFDRLIANVLVYAIDHHPKASARVREAADLMRAWNGRVDVDVVAPAIVVNTRRKLWKLLLEPKLGNEWESYQWFGSSVAMERFVLTKPARWLPAGFSDWDALLVAAAEQAVTDPAAPRDLKSWTWSTVQPVNIQHPLFGGLPLLGRISDPGAHPQSGNGSLTVKAAGKNFGASQRATYNLADWDRSNLNVVTGQSGQLFSAHYQDHWQAWYTGKSFPLPFSQAAVEKATAHKLTLHP